MTAWNEPDPEDRLELAFDGKGSGSGLAAWRANRLREIEALCIKTGVPIDRRAEVSLAQGPVLRGVIRLEEELLWNDPSRNRVVLRIGPATFTLGEIESVVRLEEEESGKGGSNDDLQERR
jgi:hypothetical protein